MSSITVLGQNCLRAEIFSFIRICTKIDLIIWNAAKIEPSRDLAASSSKLFSYILQLELLAHPYISYCKNLRYTSWSHVHILISYDHWQEKVTLILLAAKCHNSTTKAFEDQILMTKSFRTRYILFVILTIEKFWVGFIACPVEISATLLFVRGRRDENEYSSSRIHEGLRIIRSSAPLCPSWILSISHRRSHLLPAS